jgi:hypothetical protein
MIVGWMMGRSGDSGFRRESYGRATIYTTSSPGRSDFVFFFLGSDVSFASDAATARLAIDRMALDAPAAAAGKDSGPADGSLEHLYEGIDDTRLLRGALVNPHGEIVRMLRRLAPEDIDVDEMEPRWGAMEGLTIAGAFENEKDFSIVLEAIGPDEAWAWENADALGADCGEILSPAGVDAPCEAHPEGRRVHLSARIEDPATQLERLMQHRESERRRDRQEDERRPEPSSAPPGSI